MIANAVIFVITTLVTLPTLTEQLSIQCTKSPQSSYFSRKTTDRLTSKSDSIASKFWLISLKDTVSYGLSGAAAGALQVILLMWLRTTMQYQLRYGLSTVEAMRQLYAQGGIMRFYSGLTFALVQAPLARFGSVAANTGAEKISSILSKSNRGKVLLTTFLGALLATFWRLLLMPIETCKTVMQVNGLAGIKLLVDSVLRGEISSLFKGSLATVFGAWVAHYSWFVVYNSAEVILPARSSSSRAMLQNAAVGFMASAFSDLITNPIRVLKTIKQSLVAEEVVGYAQIARDVISNHGMLSMLNRGLLTRLLSNGIQSMLFTVLWKEFTKKNRKKPTPLEKYSSRNLLGSLNR